MASIQSSDSSFSQSVFHYLQMINNFCIMDTEAWIKDTEASIYVHERAEKIGEGIVGEFCLFFSSIEAVSLQLVRGVAKQLVQNRAEAFSLSFLHY